MAIFIANTMTIIQYRISSEYFQFVVNVLKRTIIVNGRRSYHLNSLVNV